MNPLKGIPIDPLIAGDIHGSASKDNTWLYYEGPLYWKHELPSGHMAIVSWVDCTEDQLTHRYHVYVYQPHNFDAIQKNIIDLNLPVRAELAKADVIYVVDWLMASQPPRRRTPGEAVQAQWDQLNEDDLPTVDATLRDPDEPGEVFP